MLGAVFRSCAVPFVLLQLLAMDDRGPAPEDVGGRVPDGFGTQYVNVSVYVFRIWHTIVNVSANI